MTNARETAWRVFSTELNSASYEIKAEAEKMPSYQLSRLGARINRVLIAGILTEKENVGTDDEPMWRGRIQDVASGTVYINIGRFQPDAAAAMAKIEAPCLIAVMGKVKSYTTEDQRTFVSVRPERVVPITESIRSEWLLDTARSTWDRMVKMQKALKAEDRSAEGLKKTGLSDTEAAGISQAIEVYGPPEAGTYLISIQNALRAILPDDNIDLGLPEDSVPEGPEEIDIDVQPGDPKAAADASPSSEDREAKEAAFLKLIKELDTDGKGAARDELERRAEQEGISSMELEEITDGLLNKGLAYEPNLRYVKVI